MGLNSWRNLYILSSLLYLVESTSDEFRNESGHLKPFGDGGPNHNIEEVDGFLDPETFFQQYVFDNNMKPVVFKGAAKLSPAFDKWTDAYFLSIPQANNEMVDVETVKKEERKQKVLTFSFTEFVKIYNNSKYYMVNGVPNVIKKDILLPCPIQCLDIVEKGLVDNVMWFSSGGTKSVVHTDAVDNLNCLYRGKKTFVMVDPKKYGDKVDLDRPEGAYSDMDVDSVDYSKYPGMAEIEFEIAELEAGDCLYIPYRWIHQVRSHGSNLAVNIWWDHYKGIKTNIDTCYRECDLEMTLANVDFKGFSESMETKEAVKDQILSIIGVHEHINYRKFEGTFLENIYEALKARGIDYESYMPFIREMFVLMDSNGDSKVTRKELNSLSAEKMDGVYENFKAVESFFDEKIADFESQDIENQDDDNTYKDEL